MLDIPGYQFYQHFLTAIHHPHVFNKGAPKPARCDQPERALRIPYRIDSRITGAGGIKPLQSWFWSGLTCGCPKKEHRASQEIWSTL